ncbi:MAG: enoyl-ACP reductase [Akkermansia sp.]|nr:enoyl-ACP reductase [Akkermansia sp.]
MRDRLLHSETTTMSQAKPLEGKVGIVTGVANKRSIAFFIAKAWHEAGARLIFNYQGERLKEGVLKLVHETFGEDTPVCGLDVSSDESIAAFFDYVRAHTDRVDCLLHAIAFAPKDGGSLGGHFSETTRESFRISLDISAFSLVALSRAVAPLMTNGGSIVAMTYHGSRKVVPNYNLMGVSKAALEACTRYLAADLGKSGGIRVNCISAGPMQTLAARGVSGFGEMLKIYGAKAPMSRSCTGEELGAAGVFLASDAAASITGQVIYVDGGYSIMGM